MSAKTEPLVKDIEKTTKRLAELRGDLEALQGQIQAKTETLAGELVEARGIESGLSDLASLERKESVIGAAMDQLTGRLDSLRAELFAEEKRQAEKELASLDRSGQAAFLQALESLYGVFEALDAYSAVYLQAAPLVARFDLKPGASAAYLTWDGVIRGNLEPLARGIERALPELTQQAKAGRPERHARASTKPLPRMAGRSQETSYIPGVSFPGAPQGLGRPD